MTHSTLSTLTLRSNRVQRIPQNRKMAAMLVHQKAPSVAFSFSLITLPATKTPVTAQRSRHSLHQPLRFEAKLICSTTKFSQRMFTFLLFLLVPLGGRHRLEDVFKNVLDKRQNQGCLIVVAFSNINPRRFSLRL